MAAYMAHFMALSFKSKSKDVPDYFFQKTLHLDLSGYKAFNEEDCCVHSHLFIKTRRNSL